MKRLVSILAVMLAIGALAETLTGKVVRVSDGDTIHVQPKKGAKEKIRLNDIDAPESNQKWGRQSTAYLQKRIGGKEVRVEWQKRDQYGRILGTVFCDGVDINHEMVKSGNAWLYHYSKNPEYSAAMQAAKSARLGLWSLPSPIDPWQWRRKR